MADKQKLIDDINRSVDAYCEASFDFSFNLKNPKVLLHEPTFGADEIKAALECLLTTRVTMGKKVKTFEKEFASKYDLDHGVMVNSGSSANLLALAALANQETEDFLSAGDEVIVPALSWSTTIWPIVQMGLVPVIVDIDPATFNMDPNEVEKAIGPKTRAIMPVHVYGNPCDMSALMDICQRKNLMLIEDCCEALGASYDGRPVGSFGRVGTFSFYYSHHMSTLEGGACVTNDFELAENMRILRAHGWIREVEDREKWLKLYPHINPRFLFVNLGYNLRATELQGAMGSVQLPKLDGYVNARRENAASFTREISPFSALIDVQKETPGGYHSWFGFTLKILPGAPFNVAEMSAHLEADQIETRPIICGNIALQPAMAKQNHRVVGDLAHATDIMNNAFAFGNHQALDGAAREYVMNSIGTFLASRGVS